MWSWVLASPRSAPSSPSEASATGFACCHRIFPVVFSTAISVSGSAHTKMRSSTTTGEAFDQRGEWASPTRRSHPGRTSQVASASGYRPVPSDRQPVSPASATPRASRQKEQSDCDSHGQPPGCDRGQSTQLGSRGVASILCARFEREDPASRAGTRTARCRELCDPPRVRPSGCTPGRRRRDRDRALALVRPDVALRAP